MRGHFDIMTDAWGQNPGDDAPDSADEDGAADEDPYAGEGGDSESPESAVPAAGPSAAPENTGDTIAALEWQLQILQCPDCKTESLIKHYI